MSATCNEHHFVNHQSVNDPVMVEDQSTRPDEAGSKLSVAVLKKYLKAISKH